MESLDPEDGESIHRTIDNLETENSRRTATGTRDTDTAAESETGEMELDYDSS